MLISCSIIIINYYWCSIDNGCIIIIINVENRFCSLIYLWKKNSGHFDYWKIQIDSKKEDICNILNVFAVTIDQFNASSSLVYFCLFIYFLVVFSKKKKSVHWYTIHSHYIMYHFLFWLNFKIILNTKKGILKCILPLLQAVNVWMYRYKPDQASTPVAHVCRPLQAHTSKWHRSFEHTPGHCVGRVKATKVGGLRLPDSHTA